MSHTEGTVWKHENTSFTCIFCCCMWSFLCHELTTALIMLMAYAPGTVTFIEQLDSSHLHRLASQRQKMATMLMKTTYLKRLHLKKREEKKKKKWKMRCRNAFTFQHISLHPFYFVNLTSSCSLIPTHVRTLHKQKLIAGNANVAK